MPEIWDGLISDEEREVIKRSGYGGRKDVGQRPALLIIDAQYNFLGSRKPILDQLDEFPTGVGLNAWKRIESSAMILKVAREANIPVIYTRYVAGTAGSSHEKRMKRDHSKFSPDAPGSAIVDELRPGEGEAVIDKNFASAFFGTDLINRLVGNSVDTLLIMGGTTSGCVRSTAIDASNYGFKAVLIKDCVFDRIAVSHRAAMLDIWMKYGILMDSVEVADYLSSL